ncbi:hypothetical protein [Actinacidiphila acididurans]|uniref:Ankyrin n=1 Tax=Actinacidiphila acididurans TaxID=2784346 RepID=A0ABS2U059_9ACTN|nr:hypothetical protein [Actinacidiphila acididurans]MBM9507593.1 hypothetical protein [Actinacidiphila acididurans]
MTVGEFGEFEAHITVRCPDGAAAAIRLARWSAERGWKFTHIVLARGRVPSQPMVTLRGRGSYEEQVRVCRRAAGALRAAGFPPVRVKIEVPPWDPVVPRSDAQALLPGGLGGRADGAGRYFEHHLKVLLTPGAPDAAVLLDALTATAVAHDAHVSWNARRIRAGTGREERFVTQRCHGVGLPTARARLAALKRSVVDLGVEIAEVEQEFVVHDSNLAVDEGWIVMTADEAARR